MGDLPKWMRDHPRTTAAVVLQNLLPLVGVLAFGWSVALVLALYWFETVVVLLFTLLAGLIAGNEPDPRDEEGRLTKPIQYHLNQTNWRFELPFSGPTVYVRNVPVVFKSGLFLGFFLAFQGLILKGYVSELSGSAFVAFDWWVALAAVTVVAGKAGEFHSEQFVDRQYRDRSAIRQVLALFPRIFVLYAVLIFGGIFALEVTSVPLGTDVRFVAVLVAIKAPVELGLSIPASEAGASPA